MTFATNRTRSFKVINFYKEDPADQRSPRGIRGLGKTQEIWYNSIMKLRQSLFWDTNIKNIDLKKNARYVIERVLEFGQPNEVGWVMKKYPKSEIKTVMNLPRSQVHPKSKALWSLLLK